MRLRYSLALMGLLVMGAIAPGILAQQTSTALVAPPTSLLPASFGTWKATTAIVDAPEPAMSLVNANQAALEECSPQRSDTSNYTYGGRSVRVEAIEFADATGAWSAYTLLRQPGLRDGKELGQETAAGSDAVLFHSGTVVALVYPATVADFKLLKPLEAALPKAHGSQALAPLLPTFLPASGLQPGSVRYALGAATYAAEGGILPAAGLGWDKSAEAITANYADKRGEESLTLLLYPTPQIAKAHLKLIEGMMLGMGPKFATAQTRQQAELVMLASGSFSAAAAQQLLGGIHMNTQVSYDKAPPIEFHAQLQQTFSMLTSIAVLAGVLMLAAVLLGLFLGGARACVRLLQGKPAAMEPEFLSLHLAPQNATAQFTPDSGPNDTKL